MGNTLSSPIPNTFNPHCELHRSPVDVADLRRKQALTTLHDHEGYVGNRARNILDLAQASADAMDTIGKELRKITNTILRALVAQAVAIGLSKLGQVHLASLVEAAWVVNEVRELHEVLARAL